MFSNIGLPGLLLIAVVVLVLFGRGRVSQLMGEVGQGIRAFRSGVQSEASDESTAAPSPKASPAQLQAPATSTAPGAHAPSA